MAASINPLDMSGRRVLVTGASSGLGRKTAIMLSQLGAHVVVIGRHEARLTEVYELLTGYGHRKELIDLSVSEEIPQHMTRIASQFGRFHGVVHCAGIERMTPLRSLRSDEIAGMLRVNLAAGMFLAQGFTHRDVHCAPSAMVLMASIAGMVGQPGHCGYSACEGGVIAFVKSAALELARKGIRINAVSAGTVFDPDRIDDPWENVLTSKQVAAIESRFPLGFGDVSDVAAAICFLISDAAKWITGTSMVVDGGYTCQ